MLWPLVASAAVPAVASAFGQERANRQNQAMAREQMAFQKESQVSAMKFEERMSSTSWQRAVEDMKLAGINPMLAASQGGASTPSIGGMSGASATMQDVISPAVASAQHARRLKEELDNLHADTEAKIRQGNLLDQQRWESLARQQNTEVGTALQKAQLPAALNAARVEESRVGAGAAWVDRVMRSLWQAVPLLRRR